MRHSFIIFLFMVSLLSNAQENTAVADKPPKAGFINFIPDTFSNKFSLNINPVLKIHSGDTIRTETIDAGGYDKKGVKRQKGGNPLTGPFYIENALPGDVLMITLLKVALNRPGAFTTESFVSRSLPKEILKDLKKPRLVKWKLDTQTGFATTADSAYEHLHTYRVPLAPFLGCIGVAPATKKNEILSFFQGPFGGNLDFKAITQSAIVYLPVFHEGAYLYFGDGHALQGDGEIAGNALETSLDIDFSVKVIKNSFHDLKYPAVEDSLYFMAIGVGKTLDKALKIATTGLLEWLQADFKLTIQEATQVMSTAIEYTIAEIADPEVEVVAKIKKELLQGLTKHN